MILCHLILLIANFLLVTFVLVEHAVPFLYYMIVFSNLGNFLQIDMITSFYNIKSNFSMEEKSTIDDKEQEK